MSLLLKLTNYMIILSILSILSLVFGIYFFSKYRKLKIELETYKRSLRNESSWHQVGRQDVTDKPYSIKDNDWIVGPGLNPPAFLPNSISNVRDLMNHSFREGKNNIN